MVLYTFMPILKITDFKSQQEYISYNKKRYRQIANWEYRKRMNSIKNHVKE